MNLPNSTGISANTERAVRSDLRIFARWCDERGETALPATPETVAAFVDAMAEIRAPATVRRYVASLAIAHRPSGTEQMLKTPPVRHAHERMRRRKGREQTHAHALTAPLQRRMLEASGERLIDLRNRALLAVAYDSMLRRSELVALQVSDLLEEPRGDATLLVRRAGTGRAGPDETAWIAPGTVRLVRAWLERAGIDKGAMFRSVRTGGKIGERLDPGNVGRIFKTMAREADLPETIVAGLSGSSARIGAARDMLAAGIEVPDIVRAGRWKSPAMLSRYALRPPAGRSGAAQLARLQKRA